MASILNVDQINNAAGTTALSIDSGGNVTSQNPLSVTDPIIVVAYSTTTFSSTGILIWNNKPIDTANAYSTSTGQFTAPRAGYYDIGFQYLFRGSSGSYHRVNVRKNNTKVHMPSHSDATMIYTNIGGQIMQGARTIVECAVNDTLDVYIKIMQSPSDIYGNGNCHNQLVIKYIG